MKEKFYKFLAGRYGGDELSRFCSFLAMALIVINIFVRSTTLWALCILLLVAVYVRMFSKNFEKRRKENARFLALKNKLTGGFRNWNDRRKQSKDYVFFRCPSCHAMLRVPRGKGKIRVTCRKCGNAFEKKT
jgi:hypothetical protein